MIILNAFVPAVSGIDFLWLPKQTATESLILTEEIPKKDNIRDEIVIDEICVSERGVNGKMVKGWKTER